MDRGAAMAESIAAGKLVDVDELPTLADSLGGRARFAGAVGDDGDDFLNGGKTKGDVLKGKAGDDILVARDGQKDEMYGGAGKDSCWDDNKLYRGDRVNDTGEGIEKALRSKPKAR